MPKFHFISFHFGREMNINEEVREIVSLHFLETQETPESGNTREGKGVLRPKNRRDGDQTALKIY